MKQAFSCVVPPDGIHYVSPRWKEKHEWLCCVPAGITLPVTVALCAAVPVCRANVLFISYTMQINDSAAQNVKSAQNITPAQNVKNEQADCIIPITPGGRRRI